jgi:hypothetical protein
MNEKKLARPPFKTGAGIQKLFAHTKTAHKNTKSGFVTPTYDDKALTSFVRGSFLA